MNLKYFQTSTGDIHAYRLKEASFCLDLMITKSKFKQVTSIKKIFPVEVVSPETGIKYIISHLTEEEKIITATYYKI